jgi:hypothetical protein
MDKQRKEPVMAPFFVENPEKKTAIPVIFQ